jgi:hypothetical protein
MKFFASCWAFVLAVGCHQPPQVEDMQEAAVPHFAGMTLVEADKALQAMKDRGDIDGLTAIARSDTAFAGWAAADVVGALPFPQAVVFCNGFGVGSRRWASAFYGFWRHKREDVVGYVRDLISRPDPTVRFHCYRLFMQMGWDDFVAQAEKDRNSRVQIDEANQPQDEQTLGDIATKYVNSLRNPASPHPR